MRQLQEQQIMMQLEAARRQQAEAEQARLQAAERERNRSNFLGAIDAMQGPALPVTQDMLPRAMLSGFTPQEFSTLMPPKPEPLPLAKIDPKDYTPESFQQFVETRNPALLRRAAPSAPIPDPTKDLLIVGPNGTLVPNTALIDIKKQLRPPAATQSVTIDQKAEGAFKIDQAKSLSEMMTNINKAGFEAPTMIRKLERMEQLLEGVDGGRLAPTGLEVASAANALGIKLDPKLGNKEAAQALAREIAGGFRQPGTGPMTDKDFENFLLQVPDLSKTAEGRKQITATMRAAANRSIAISRMAREYVKKNGQLDNDFLDAAAQFVAENPVVAAPAGWRVR